MAWTSGFFNSVNGDRLYNAQQMSEIFEGLITEGVYASVGNKLAVQPNSGMTVQIATGRGWVGKHWVNNDSEYLQVIEGSDVLLNRYCAVCIRADETDSVRDAVPYFKYSEFATKPVKPTMERTETVTERCLAYIYIRAGATEIKASDIEDTRGNSELCGWVTGLIEQLSTTTLFEQWTDLFNEWFTNLQDLINENTEAMLVSAMPVNLTISLPESGWVEIDNKYTQTTSVLNMSETKSVIVSANAETADIYNASAIRATSQGANELTFTAETLPTGTVKVDIVHMGV